MPGIEWDGRLVQPTEQTVYPHGEDELGLTPAQQAARNQYQMALARLFRDEMEKSREGGSTVEGDDRIVRPGDRSVDLPAAANTESGEP